VTRRHVLAAAAGAAGAVMAAATPAHAHGVGGRGDLPLPLWQFLYAAGAALVVSFFALRLLWPSPRLGAASGGRPLPGPVDRCTAALTVVLRVLGVGLWALTLVAAWAGTTNSAENLAPVLVYVLLWVGVQGLSAIFGDVWRALSPFDTIAAVAHWIRERRWPGPARELPDDGSLARSHWLAAAGVLGFTWLELAYHSPAEPRVLAIVITGYSAVMLGGAVRYGRDWLRTGDAFAVLFGLIALIAPFHRGADGRLRVRLPFTGLATMRARGGTIALVTIMLGSTGFDGVSRTRWWQDVLGETSGWGRTATNTFGMLWIVGIVLAAYFAASMASAFIAGTDRDAAPRNFAASLVPIGLGYAIAHYFSLFVIEGQSAIALVSDPLGRDWDLFGTATRAVDLTIVSATTIAWVQVAAIVVGHVAGVVIAHDRAVEELPHRVATRSQYPMLAVMVAYTVGGLALLLGA
jgi:hypothetical protein